MAGKPRKIAEEYANCSTRDAILAAAEQLCGDQGVQGIKLRGIARKVGIEPASVYSHFKSLDDVLYHVAASALDDLSLIYEGLEEATPENAVYLSNLKMIRFLSRNRGVARLFMNDFAAAQRLPAFSENDGRIHNWISADIAMMRQKFDLNESRAPELHELFLAKLGMVGNLLAVRWCRGTAIEDNDLERFARMASALVVSYADELR